MNNRFLDKHLIIAKEAASTAGRYLSSYKKDDILIESQQGKDIKISADRESEKIIVDVLRAKSALAILSEEKGLIGGAGNSNLMWIIDPLDGSLNFLRGIPNCCVSIGLCDGSKPMLGVIYDFYRKELFTGISGVEAWLNKKKITVSEINAERDAILFSGFPADTDFSPEALKNYVEQVRAFKKVRLMGSAALSLAYVAAGRGDAYFERDIMFWDIAAGLAILSGAGGEYSVKATPRNNVYNVYATNKFLQGILGKYDE